MRDYLNLIVATVLTIAFTNAKSGLSILKKILKWIDELTFDRQSRFMKSL